MACCNSCMQQVVKNDHGQRTMSREADYRCCTPNDSASWAWKRLFQHKLEVPAIILVLFEVLHLALATARLVFVLSQNLSSSTQFLRMLLS